MQNYENSAVDENSVVSRVLNTADQQILLQKEEEALHERLYWLRCEIAALKALVIHNESLQEDLEKMEDERLDAYSSLRCIEIKRQVIKYQVNLFSAHMAQHTSEIEKYTRVLKALKEELESYSK